METQKCPAAVEPGPHPVPSLMHIEPTPEDHAAALAFLRGDALDQRARHELDAVVNTFGWAEKSYIEEARTQGESSRVWLTTSWIIANALAGSRVRR